MHLLHRLQQKCHEQIISKHQPRIMFKYYINAINAHAHKSYISCETYMLGCLIRTKGTESNIFFYCSPKATSDGTNTYCSIKQKANKIKQTRMKLRRLKWVRNLFVYSQNFAVLVNSAIEANCMSIRRVLLEWCDLACGVQEQQNTRNQNITWETKNKH